MSTSQARSRKAHGSPDVGGNAPLLPFRDPWLLERMQSIVDAGLLCGLSALEARLLFVCATRADKDSGRFRLSVRYLADRAGVKDTNRVCKAMRKLKQIGAVEQEAGAAARTCPYRVIAAVKPRTPQELEAMAAGRTWRTGSRQGGRGRDAAVHEERGHEERGQPTHATGEPLSTFPVKPLSTFPVGSLSTKNVDLPSSLPSNSSLNHAAHGCGPLRGTQPKAVPDEAQAGDSGDGQATRTGKRRHSAHEGLRSTDGGYRSLTDYWCELKRGEDRGFEFGEADGPLLAKVWRGTKKNPLLAKAILTAYFADPSYEGHPAKGLIPIDKWRMRASRQARGAQRGYTGPDQRLGTDAGGGPVLGDSRRAAGRVG